MNNTSNWKGFERAVSSYFGGKGRTPLSGINSKHTGADILHNQLFVECKKRKKHSIITLWDKCKAAAVREGGKIPVVALSEKNRKGFWLLIHSSDLVSVGNVREQARKEGT